MSIYKQEKVNQFHELVGIVISDSVGTSCLLPLPHQVFGQVDESKQKNTTQHVVSWSAFNGLNFSEKNQLCLLSHR
jgi:hypothetical protein